MILQPHMCKTVGQPEPFITHVCCWWFRKNMYKYVYFMVIWLKLEAENVGYFHGICRVLNN